MAAMREARFGFEVEAEQRGRVRGRDEGRNEGRIEGRIEMLYTLVRDEKLMLSQAAQYAGVSEAEFASGMKHRNCNFYT